MRLFYIFTLFIIPSLVYAQTCTETTFNTSVPNNTYYCSSLVIGGAGINKSADGNPDSLQIIVNGDVEIKANIFLDGGNGDHIIIAPSNDSSVALGGPGGFVGGGYAASSSQPGGSVDPADGSAGENDFTCSSGGGGAAGADSDGEDGSLCTSGTSFGAKGISPSTLNLLIGGYGGGAGGYFTYGANRELGAGGGGGGSLFIQATGKIIISDGVKIFARGGSGGNSIDLGGAGGGGGGGNIHLKAQEISNKGIFDVRGGNGGINTSTSSPKGGDGGNGGNGIIRFEINGVDTNLTGIQDYSSGLPTSTTQSLKSDISCGTIVPKNNDSNTFFQMMSGFFIVAMMSALLKTLFRFPKKF